MKYGLLKRRIATTVIPIEAADHWAASRGEGRPLRIFESNEGTSPGNRAATIPSFVGQSSTMRRLLDDVARVAPKDVTVLVRGETGTGKELIAWCLHAQSSRAPRPMVRFNCAAIPGELAEAELFGHARGAFTGATHARPGFFAQAHRGTLVLDEVGELSAPVQAKLLRALQEGEIQPVGAGRVEKVDVRIVACTNRDLSAEAKAHRFREDLYYRLAVVELLVPPLREHREDIAPLAAEFARRYAHRFGMDGVRLSPALVEALRTADWPGNVRQLENTVARIVALHDNSGDVGAERFTGASTRPAEPGTEPVPEGYLGLREQVDALERSIITRTLAAVSGNKSEAARRLGLSRTSLIDRLNKYRFNREPGFHAVTIAVKRGCRLQENQEDRENFSEQAAPRVIEPDRALRR